MLMGFHHYSPTHSPTSYSFQLSPSRFQSYITLSKPPRNNIPTYTNIQTLFRKNTGLYFCDVSSCLCLNQNKYRTKYNTPFSQPCPFPYSWVPPATQWWMLNTFSRVHLSSSQWWTLDTFSRVHLSSSPSCLKRLQWVQYNSVCVGLY